MNSKAELVRAAGQGIAGLCIVGVVAWAAVEAISADPAVGGSIVVAVVGALAVVFERSRVEQGRRREVQRERMEPMYKDFVEHAQQAFGAGRSTPEAKEFFTKFKGKELLLGADAQVIQALVTFEKTTSSDDAPLAPALAYEALLRSIRHDLGHNDSRLCEGDLLRLFSDYQ